VSGSSTDRPTLDARLLHGVQVLVVDDESDARDLLHVVLEYCGERGFSAYLTKPVEPWALCRTIDPLRRSRS